MRVLLALNLDKPIARSSKNGNGYFLPQKGIEPKTSTFTVLRDTI